jgi:uncharacterized protein (DUF2147 family)
MIAKIRSLELRQVFFSAAVLGASIGIALAEPTGLWLAGDGAQIQIAPCGNDLCGVLVRTASPVDPMTKKPWTDKNNVDPRLQTRSLLGVQVLIGMRPNGAGKWLGRLYNTDDGKIYTGKLSEIDGRKIRVEGCVSFLCGGENMTRVK